MTQQTPAPAPGAGAIVAELRKTNELLVQILAALQQPRPAPSRASSDNTTGASVVEGAIADDEDLDGQHGDPEIRYDPPRWKGESYVDCHYSEASPEYLECLAKYLDWKAGKADEKDERVKGGALKSTFIKRDAARARGWRKRALEASGRNPTQHRTQRYEPAPDV